MTIYEMIMGYLIIGAVWVLIGLLVDKDHSWAKSTNSLIIAFIATLLTIISWLPFAIYEVFRAVRSARR
jgi:ABC-type Fe3+ transport system permease subunit